ncbi:MAG TPA: DUF5715 family protein [Rubricoccaceae bacterium]
MPTPAPALTTPGPPVRPDAPPARRPDVWVWLRRALVVAVLAGAVLGACETARGVRETMDRADQAAARAEAALRAVPLLTDADLARLRRSLNPRHVALGEELGVSPSDTLGAADRGLVRVDTLRAVVALDGTYSDPLLTPDAAAALDSVAARFRAGLAAAGAPPFRPVATSLLRSSASQAALRRVNANAAAGRSSHEFGTTFDLAYRRFEPLPPAVAVSPRVPRPLHGAVGGAASARLAREHARLAAEYPSRLDALLGRALVGLEDAGVLVVVRERNQAVYHVTVARRLAAE